MVWISLGEFFIELPFFFVTLSPYFSQEAFQFPFLIPIFELLSSSSRVSRALQSVRSSGAFAFAFWIRRWLGVCERGVSLGHRAFIQGLG